MKSRTSILRNAPASRKIAVSRPTTRTSLSCAGTEARTPLQDESRVIPSKIRKESAATGTQDANEFAGEIRPGTAIIKGGASKVVRFTSTVANSKPHGIRTAIPPRARSPRRSPPVARPPWLPAPSALAGSAPAHTHATPCRCLR